MGNICSIQISCDAIFSRCLDCTIGKVAYIRELEDNLEALQTELQKLIEARNDVMATIIICEHQQMKRTHHVQGWLSRVQTVEAEVAELLEVKSLEIDKLCLRGYCSKSCKSSYKFAKKVAKKLQVVVALKGEGTFQEVAKRLPEAVVDERPTEPTIVGLQPTFDKVWKSLGDEQVGIIGIYGMGGVGKTTLLTQINNKFVDTQHGVDVVIWLVVSKDVQLESIQEKMAKKLSFFDESWKNKSVEEKALDIFKSLSKKKFVLLFDDLWERVDLIKMGVPFPSLKNASKLVFTTRDFEVCGEMEAQKCFKVECLGYEDALKLFQEKVGRDTLESHPDIPELAKIIVHECDGLPLALITVGRAMSCKKSPQEWNHAVEVLRKSASKFSEDHSIYKEDLIDCWIANGLLDEYEGSEARNHGYSIIGALLSACLLEEVDDSTIKMHDVVRDMALWIACDIEKERESFLVLAGFGLTELPEIRLWEGVKRLSFIENKIENLSKTPTCPSLQTLFLNHNRLKTITSDFFQFMPSLQVLNLSNNRSLRKLPSGISKLVSLQHLDLSWTDIKELPKELEALVNLKSLSLEHTFYLHTIPQELITHFSMLQVLRMFCCGLSLLGQVAEYSVFFGGGKFLVDELLGLKYLIVLTVTLKSFQSLQSFLSSSKLRSCTQSLCIQCFEGSSFLNISSLADLKNLHTLHISSCEYLEELKIDCAEAVLQTREPYAFHSLHTVEISFCIRLRDLTWLICIPNLKFLSIYCCDQMEEIINFGKLGEISKMMGNLNPFPKLHSLELHQLPKLKSIYGKAMPFLHLKEIEVRGCLGLKKLPLDSNSAKEHKIVIKGEEHWWKELQWEDQDTQNLFLPCFKPNEI